MQSVWTPSSWHDYFPTFGAIFSCHVHMSMRFWFADASLSLWSVKAYCTLWPDVNKSQCGFLCLFVCLFVCSFVCLCVLLFSFVCFLVSLFYDDRWYLCISNLYIAGSVVKTKSKSGFLCLFVCLFVWSLVCLCVLPFFSVVCFLVSLLFHVRCSSKCQNLDEHFNQNRQNQKNWEIIGFYSEIRYPFFGLL